MHTVTCNRAEISESLADTKYDSMFPTQPHLQGPCLPGVGSRLQEQLGRS